MTDTTKHFGTKSYLLNLAWAIGLAMLANAFIFFVNPAEEGPKPGVAFAPPGYVIAVVWVFLFAAMSTSRWLTLRANDRVVARLVTVLIAVCAMYPVYTLALSSVVIGIWGNVVTGVLALVIAVMAFRRSPWGASLLLLVVGWLCFATFLAAEQMKGISA